MTPFYIGLRREEDDSALKHSEARLENIDVMTGWIECPPPEWKVVAQFHFPPNHSIKQRSNSKGEGA